MFHVKHLCRPFAGKGFTLARAATTEYGAAGDFPAVLKGNLLRSAKLEFLLKPQ